MPRRQITIVPTWDSVGLYGSGSDDVKVEELFVPEHMTLPISYLRGGETPGNHLHPAPLYRSPSYMWFGILLNSASLGMAEGILIDYVGEAKKRVALMSGQETRSSIRSWRTLVRPRAGKRSSLLSTFKTRAYSAKVPAGSVTYTLTMVVATYPARCPSQRMS